MQTYRYKVLKSFTTYRKHIGDATKYHRGVRELRKIDNFAKTSNRINVWRKGKDYYYDSDTHIMKQSEITHILLERGYLEHISTFKKLKRWQR